MMDTRTEESKSSDGADVSRVEEHQMIMKQRQRQQREEIDRLESFGSDANIFMNRN